MVAEEGCNKVIDQEEGTASNGEQHPATIRTSQPRQDRRHQQLYSTLLGNEPQESSSHPRKAYQGPPLRKGREGETAAAQRGHQEDRGLHPCASDLTVGEAQAKRAQRQWSQQDQERSRKLKPNDHNPLLRPQHCPWCAVGSVQDQL